MRSCGTIRNLFLPASFHAGYIAFVQVHIFADRIHKFIVIERLLMRHVAVRLAVHNVSNQVKKSGVAHADGAAPFHHTRTVR